MTWVVLVSERACMYSLSSPVFDVVVASAGNTPGNLGELVVVLRVQLHHQRIFLGTPNLVLLDGRIDVVVVPLTALLGGSPWHHLRDLGPADESGTRTKKEPAQRTKRDAGC